MTITIVSMLRVAGKMSDVAAGRELGCGRDYVFRFRTARGIPAWQNVRHQQWWELARHEVGKASDATVGERYGVSAQWVALLRMRDGVPAYRKQKPRAASERKPGRPCEWWSEAAPAVGRMPDGVIAMQYGLAVVTVRMQRRKHGIAPYRGPRKVWNESTEYRGNPNGRRRAA